MGVESICRGVCIMINQKFKQGEKGSENIKIKDNEQWKDQWMCGPWSN